MNRLRTYALLGSLLTVAGCATQISPSDDGAVRGDAASDVDFIDTSVRPDGGPGFDASDAGPTTDTPIAIDARPVPDSAPPVDAPPQNDVPRPSDVVQPTDVPPGVDANDVVFPRDVPPPSDAIDVPTIDVPPPTDARNDVSFPPDAPPPVDASDVVFPRDVPPPNDASDVTFPPDAPNNTIVGRWRAVRYDFVQNGMNQTLTDVDSPFPIGGGAFIDGRINGELFVTGTRFAESFGVLLNDHFYINDMAANVQSALSAYGVVIAGTASGGTFSFFGGSFSYVFNPDGTITQFDTTNNTALTWAPAQAPTPSAEYMGAGQAAFYQSSTATPIMHPRLVLAWDRPGINTGAVYSNDVPLTFGPFNTAQYALDVIAPPATAVASLGGTQAALAYILVYDDLNLSGAYEPGRDNLRGISNVAIAWRAGLPSAAFSSSALRDIDEGFQNVVLATDYSNGRSAAEPWDPSNPVSPDIALNPTVDSRPLPDIVR